jgi:hypothetical protein
MEMKPNHAPVSIASRGRFFAGERFFALAASVVVFGTFGKTPGGYALALAVLPALPLACRARRRAKFTSRAARPLRAKRALLGFNALLRLRFWALCCRRQLIAAARQPQNLRFNPQSHQFAFGSDPQSARKTASAAAFDLFLRVATD